jgi:hypothetical protein
MLGFRLVFTSNGSVTPTVNGVQVRALPAVPRSELVQVPLLCFDFERDKFGVPQGYEGAAKARWLRLRDAVRDGDVIRFQDLTNGESLEAVVEDMQFDQIAPPSKAVSGFGGIIMITVRTTT